MRGASIPCAGGRASASAFILPGSAESAVKKKKKKKKRRHCPSLPAPDVVVAALKSCTASEDLARGLRIHGYIAELASLQTDIYLGNALINLYGKCGDLASARDVFDAIRMRDVVTWTTLIGAYAHHRHLQQQQQHHLPHHQLGPRSEDPISLFYRMRAEAVAPDAFSLVHIFKACATSSSMEALGVGERLHAEAMLGGQLSDPFVSIALLDMYARCGSFSKGRQIFDSLPFQSAVAWNALMAGFMKHHGSYKALLLYEEMQAYGTSPDPVSFACILKACGELEAIGIGSDIHGKGMVREELKKGNVLLGNALINMYAKCGALREAHDAFDDLPSWNVASFCALFVGYVEDGRCEEALYLFEQMECHGSIRPDVVSFACILKACGLVGALDKGEEIHSKIRQRGCLFTDDLRIGNALVDMYARCGQVEKAQEVFDRLPNPDHVSWSILIAGYVQNGRALEALDCFDEVRKQGLLVDALTYMEVLKACGAAGDFKKGFEVHDEVIRGEFLEEDLSLGTALVDMYAKCGACQVAREVFDRLEVKDLVSWSALIGGYSFGEEAMHCFQRLMQECLVPDAIVYVCALKSCSNTGDLEKGKEIHAMIQERLLEENTLLVGSALVDMYSKCGSISRAEEAFKRLSACNVVAWNALIFAYIQGGLNMNALHCFDTMVQEGFAPTTITFAYALKACSGIKAIENGKHIHAEVVREGLLRRDDAFIGNALMDMYVKCGELCKARDLLDELPVQDVVTWNSLVSGCAQQGHDKEAMEGFEEMQQRGIPPDGVTFIGIIKTCGNIGSLRRGKEIHAKIIKEDMDFTTGNALVNMYAKCGAPREAQEVFEELPDHDESSWTSLMTAYSQLQEDTMVVSLFNRMLQERIHPDSLTFTVVLTACSHAGLMDQGKEYFASMAAKFGIIPTVEHHTCMIDLFGRAGHFDEVVEAIARMPVTLDYLPMWSSLLGSCQKWGNVALGELAFDNCFRLAEDHASGYVSMRNIYMQSYKEMQDLSA